MALLNFVCLLQFAVFVQELLALGERIGHVSTGLTEEKVMSGLKQWKYLHIPLEVEPPTGVEPCCICQVIQMIVFSFTCFNRFS
jgi:hypothetical protein